MKSLQCKHVLLIQTLFNHDHITIYIIYVFAAGNESERKRNCSTSFYDVGRILGQAWQWCTVTGNQEAGVGSTTLPENDTDRSSLEIPVMCIFFVVVRKINSFILRRC